MKRLVITTTLCIVLQIPLAHVVSASASATPLDSWLAAKQETVTSPGYYEGQKRGYILGGSYSARVRPSASEHLFTAQKPYLKTGCGGIDIFMGSFSFLNADWLMQKGQQMIQAAPFVAFDLALSTLSPQISEKFKAAMSIIDRLNQLQLDECQATTGIVARVMSEMPGITEDQKKSFAEKGASKEIISGGSSLFSAITNFGKEPNKLQNRADSVQQTQECPAEVKAFYQPGSMLANVASKYTGLMNTEYTELIRGYLGDVRIIQDATTANMFIALPIAPCEENKNKSLDDFVSGNITVMGSDFVCKPATGTTLSFMHAVQSQLATIANKIEHRLPLSVTENNFIDVTPIPLSNAIKTGISTGTASSVIATVSDVVARAYAFYFVSDLYYLTVALWERGMTEMAKANSKGSANRDAEAGCNMDVYLKVFPEMKRGLERTYIMQQQLKTEYATIAAQTNSILEFIDRLNQFDELYTSRFARRR